MKHITIYDQYDFLGMQAAKHGLTREEYTAHYLSEQNTSMEHVKLYEQFVNEAKVDKKYFDKVVKVLSKSKYPFTMMLVTKWNEVDIVIGQDAPDDIIDDISQRLHKAKLNWGGGSGITISGDSSNYSRREYDEITRINGGHRDY